MTGNDEISQTADYYLKVEKRVEKIVKFWKKMWFSDCTDHFTLELALVSLNSKIEKFQIVMPRYNMCKWEIIKVKSEVTGK